MEQKGKRENTHRNPTSNNKQNTGKQVEQGILPRKFRANTNPTQTSQKRKAEIYPKTWQKLEKQNKDKTPTNTTGATPHVILKVPIVRNRPAFCTLLTPNMRVQPEILHLERPSLTAFKADQPEGTKKQDCENGHGKTMSSRP
jgi:hypothetical protein